MRGEVAKLAFAPGDEVLGGEVAGIEMVGADRVFVGSNVELVHVNNVHPGFEFGQEGLELFVEGDRDQTVQEKAGQLLERIRRKDDADVAPRKGERQVRRHRRRVTLDAIMKSRFGKDGDLAKADGNLWFEIERIGGAQDALTSLGLDLVAI